MDPTNDTLTEENAPAPPDNPMYAGGIAVLVAFVLFMYWGSLNETGGQKNGKSSKHRRPMPCWFNVPDENYVRKKKKKKKRKRSGVYCVSDAAMHDRLLSDNTREEASSRGCADCQMCQYYEYEIQNQWGFSKLHGKYLLSKGTQTSPNRNTYKKMALSSSSIQTVRKEVPRTKRAYSSPEIITRKSDLCTCRWRTQNGGSGSPQKCVVTAIDDTDYTINKNIYNDKISKCAEDTAEALFYERGTANGVGDLEKTYRNAMEKQNVVEVKKNGKILRQIEDAHVCLESHPHIVIPIVVETTV